jgi:hypothetical protein
MVEPDTEDLPDETPDLGIDQIEEVSGGLRRVRRSQSQFDRGDVQKIIPAPSPAKTEEGPTTVTDQPKS